MHMRLTQKQHNTPRKLAIIALTIVVMAVAAFFVYTYHPSPQVPLPTTYQKQTTLPSPDNSKDISMSVTGDWIAHDSVNAAAKTTNSYDYLRLIDGFDVLKTADIRFCNDPILNGGASLGIAGYPKFNSPTEFVTDMGKFGCNLVNTASNHSFDFTQANITNSVNAWKSVPNMLAVAGENSSPAEHDNLHYFSVKGVKFAFLAYTTYLNSDAPAQNNYGVNVFTKDVAAKQIALAKQNGAQIIIASMRWGNEYSSIVNAEQKADAQFLADQGVSLVLGHGPHVLQTVAQLRGISGNTTTVWYSLGNFLNTQLPPETLFNGVVNIHISTKTKQITTMKYLPIYMHYEWTAAQAAAENTNARHDVKLYLLENTNQSMIDKQQLKTTVAAQKQRLNQILAQGGLQIPLISSKDWK